MLVFVFFNDTATTEIYTYGHTLSLHDALPISWKKSVVATRSGSGIEVSRREARTTDILSAWTRSAVAIAAAKPRLVAAKEMPCPLDENISLGSSTSRFMRAVIASPTIRSASSARVMTAVSSPPLRTASKGCSRSEPAAPFPMGLAPRSVAALFARQDNESGAPLPTGLPGTRQKHRR